MAKLRTKTAEKKKWTLFLYLAGDNNLDAAGKADIMEMKTVGSTKDVNVVVQYDCAGKGKSTNRYYVRKATSMASDVVQSLGETNTGDPEVLSSFIQWGIKEYPADHYLLCLWNHGSGWDDSNLYAGDYFSGATPPISRKGRVMAAGRKSGARAKTLSLGVARAGIRRAHRALFVSTAERMMTTRAVAFDDQARDFLDNIELKRVLAQAAKKIGRKIDIVGFDACLMSMMEIAYQVKDTASVLVASEEEEPGDGWPYNRILQRLAARPSMSAADLAGLITQQYLASYGKNDNVTFSATDCALVGPLAERINSLAVSMTGQLGDSASRAAMMTARMQVQEYSPPYDDYCDLIDLCSLVSHHVGKPEIASACAAVASAATRAIIANGSRGPKVANSHGLALYFPKKRICSLYSTIDFGRTSAWPKFLAAYMEAIPRRPVIGS